MPRALTVSKLREGLGPRFTQVVHEHRPVLVTRGEDRALMAGLDEVVELVRDREFHPEVLRGDDGGVSYWLPEFAIYGEGPTLRDAREDLLAEIRQYVDEYLADSSYSRAPNRRAHFGHVIRAYAADVQGVLADVVFPPPPANPATASRPRSVPA